MVEEQARFHLSLWNPYTRLAANHEVRVRHMGHRCVEFKAPASPPDQTGCLGRFALLRFAPARIACPVGVRNMQQMLL
jgi:hypothetical protein